MRTIRRPAYGAYGGAPPKGRSWAISCVAISALVLLGGAVATNYVYLERSRCESRLADLQTTLQQKESAIQKLMQQLGDLRHGMPPVSAPAPAAAGRKISDSWGDDGNSDRSINEQTKAKSQRLRQPAQLPAPEKPLPAAAVVPPPPPPQPNTNSNTNNGGSSAHGSVEPAPKDPRQARALLVICYNRPQYLTRTLNSVLERLPSYNRPHVIISQDGDDGGVTQVIEGFKQKFAAQAADVPFIHWRHPAVPPEALSRAAGWALGYYKLAQHFGWALDRIFVEQGYARVIILEDDLEVAVDFFDYFTAMQPLLDADDSLLAVSAWSDIGQQQFVSDPTAVHRSDFFPGLGWMITKHHWEELGPKWPDSFWDDWLREPPQRKGRAVLRPQISRTYTFGESGVSQAQFYAEYLGNIKLNDVPVDWAGQDLGYLEKGAYDAALASDVSRARAVASWDEAVGAICTPPAASNSDEPLPAVKTVYSGFNGPQGYEELAKRFGFINDVKAGVPRTAYQGVVAIRHKGCLKLLVPADWRAPDR